MASRIGVVAFVSLGLGGCALRGARTAKKKAETAYTQAVEQAAATLGAIGTTEGGAATAEARRTMAASPG